MNMKKYLALMRAGIIESLQFRIAMFVMVIGNLLYLTLVYFLWNSIYASAGTDIVNGMTFIDTLIYLVLATALFNFMEMYTVWEIGRNVRSGKIVLDLALRFKDYAKYPITIFSPVFRFIFSFIIPIAFIAFYPGLVVLRPDDVPLLSWISPLVGGVFFFLGYKFWMYGAAKYNGTGS